MEITSTDSSIQSALEDAKAICIQKKVRFTRKRQHVLQILLTCKQAVGAYDIAEFYSQQFAENIPTMSVYRILDFLTELGFVHKLNSINKFIACQHLSCDHSHDLPQFLICNSCQHTEEFSISKRTQQDLLQSSASMNFELSTKQIELFGLCKNCHH
jgi:Fur family zinc uptake transcriptional regulator